MTAQFQLGVRKVARLRLKSDFSDSSCSLFSLGFEKFILLPDEIFLTIAHDRAASKIEKTAWNQVWLIIESCCWSTSESLQNRCYQWFG